MSQDISAGRAFVELMVKGDKAFANKLKAATGTVLKFGKVAAMAGAAAATAAAGGVAVAIRQYVAMGSELHQMATRINISVESLSALEHAAKQTGTPVDNLREGMTELVQRLGEAAATGGGSAAEQLERLGLSAQKLQQVAPEEALGQIADAVNKLPNKSDQLFAFDELMGGDSREMLGLLAQGSEGINRLTKEAADMGLVMSGDAASGAARLMQMFATIGEQIKAFASAVGAAAAPFVEQALPYIVAFGSMAIEAVRAAGNYIQEAMASVSGVVVSVWQTIWGAVGPIVLAYREAVLSAFSGIWSMVTEVMTSIGNIVAGIWSRIGETVMGVMNFLRSAIIGGLSAISFAFKNWQALLALAFVNVGLGVVRFANQIIYYFTEVIPGYLVWFFGNWRDIFTDIVTMTGTIAGNIWKNLKNLWDAIVGLFNGEGFNFEFVGLTEGFETAVKELPKIAAREAGPLEKQLEADAKALGDQLKEKWEDHGKEFAQKITPKPNEMFEEFKRRAKKAGVSGSGSGEGEGGGGPDPMGVGKAKSQVFATFSAAAAIAQGQGGSSGSDKIVQAIKESDRKREQELREQKEAYEKSMQAH